MEGQPWQEALWTPGVGGMLGPHPHPPEACSPQSLRPLCFSCVQKTTTWAIGKVPRFRVMTEVHTHFLKQLRLFGVPGPSSVLGCVTLVSFSVPLSSSLLKCELGWGGDWWQLQAHRVGMGLPGTHGQ